MTNALKSLGPPTTSNPTVGFYAGRHRLLDTSVVVQPRSTWFVPCQVSFWWPGTVRCLLCEGTSRRLACLLRRRSTFTNPASYTHSAACCCAVQ